MPSLVPTHRHRLLLLAALAGLLPAQAAADIRRIRCDRAYQLELVDSCGFIEIKPNPYAQANLKTLYQKKDSFKLEAGRDYYLMLNEAPEGYFRFDLKLTPVDQGSTWSCQVRTQAEAPFIGVTAQQVAATGQPGNLTTSTDPRQPLIDVK
jgi:hypothetical protein